jgi:hypothetical protein
VAAVTANDQVRTEATPRGAGWLAFASTMLYALAMYGGYATSDSYRGY